MSYDEAVKAVNVPGNADLSSSQFLFGKLTNSSGVARVAVCGNGEDAAGVIYEGQATAGLACKLAIGGVLKVIAGDAITSGARVASDAAGKVVPVGTGDKVLGFALASASAGDVIPVLWAPIG